MALHSTTRVPVDDSYVALVGKAVYVFAYYEWGVIYIIEFLQPGFVYRYSRGNPMTSGHVSDALKGVINDSTTSFGKITKQELESCSIEHAHPITDADGSQILAYQTKMTKPLPDMKWPRTEVGAIVAEFDNAACSAGVLLDKLR